MTREEAIARIKDHIEIHKYHEQNAVKIFEALDMAIKALEQPEIVRCKDCKFFEYDHPYVIQGMPILGHEVCSKWGNGCKTNENGWCFLAERRTDGKE